MEYNVVVDIYFLCVQAAIGIFCSVVTVFLFKNLCWIEHTWIIEPSSVTKITAVLATTGWCISSFSVVILGIMDLEYIIDDDKIEFYNEIAFQANKIADYLCFSCAISTLLNFRKKETLIQNVIPISVLYLVITLLIVIVIGHSSIVTMYFAFDRDVIDGFAFITYWNTFGVITGFIVDVLILCLCIKGFTNECHFWYSKYWKEYNEYGDTQKIHEKLIVITRYTVITMLAMLFTLINFIWETIHDHVIEKHSSSVMNVIWECTHSSIILVDTILYTLLTYFLFDFGYTSYRFLCDSCHIRMYRCCDKCYARKVEKGDRVFLEPRYKSKCCVCPSNKPKIIEEMEVSLL